MSSDCDRRMRQHNGEITGGARYTRGGRPWRTVYRVRGFRKRDAPQFECKKAPRRRRPGGARGKLGAVLRMERWTSRAPPARCRWWWSGTAPQTAGRALSGGDRVGPALSHVAFVHAGPGCGSTRRLDVTRTRALRGIRCKM